MTGETCTCGHIIEDHDTRSGSCDECPCAGFEPEDDEERDGRGRD